MPPDPQETTDLIIFNGEILSENLQFFLWSANAKNRGSKRTQVKNSKKRCGYLVNILACRNWFLYDRIQV